jgi:hypothetical protein
LSKAKPERLDLTRYGKSSRWRHRRARYFRTHPGRCFVCQQTVGITLHHRTYENVGAELDEDLVPLCVRCHDLAHHYRGGIADSCVYLARLFNRGGETALRRQTEALRQRREEKRASRSRRATKRASNKPRYVSAPLVRVRRVDDLTAEERVRYGGLISMI